MSIRTNVIEGFWKAEGVSLVGEMLERLEAGEKIQFESAIVQDDGISLARRRLLRGDEVVLFPWVNIKMGRENGSLHISVKNDNRFHVLLSYLWEPNTYIIDCIIDLALKSPNIRKLSELLS